MQTWRVVIHLTNGERGTIVTVIVTECSSMSGTAAVFRSVGMETKA